MVNIFRRFQQPLLIALTVIVILSFVVFYSLPGSRGGGIRTAPVATVYGQNVSLFDTEQAGKRFQICRDIGLFDLLRALVGNAGSLNAAENNFTYNSLVLRHEAEALGIMSSNPGEAERKAMEPEVTDRISKLPAFQGKGGFDFSRYQAFSQNRLGSQGLTVRDLQDLITDAIRLEKVKEVIGSTIAVSPDEVRLAYTEQNQKLETSVVRLKLDDFKAAVTVTDDDVKKLFDERKDTLKTPEKRKVKFASFTLPKTDPPVAGPARMELMKKQAELAESLAEAMTVKGADFDEAAKKAGATAVGETPFFEQGQPPAELQSSPQAAAAAFRLTKEQPNSDVIGLSQGGAVVMQYSGTEESRPLTLEEAKPQLQDQIKQERAQEALNLKAGEIRTKIDADLKAGKSFADAATDAGVKADKIEPFSPAERIKGAEPDAMTIMGRATEMTEGELSELTPTQTGGLLIYLEKKLPIDESGFEKEKETLVKNLEQGKSEALFEDWLHGRLKAANVQVAHL